MYSLFTLPSFWTPWLVRRCKCLIRSATSSVALGTGIRKRGPSSGTTFKRSPDMAQSPNFWDLAGLVDGWLYVEGIDVLIDVFSHYFTKAQHCCAKRRLKMFETRVLLLWHFFHRKVMSSCEAMQPKAMQPKTWNVLHPMSSCHGFSSDSYRKCQAYRVVIYLDFPQFAGVSLPFHHHLEVFARLKFSRLHFLTTTPARWVQSLERSHWVHRKRATLALFLDLSLLENAIGGGW